MPISVRRHPLALQPFKTDVQRLDALLEKVPVTRHSLAIAAMLAGLDMFERDPSAATAYVRRNRGE